VEFLLENLNVRKLSDLPRSRATFVTFASEGRERAGSNEFPERPSKSLSLRSGSSVAPKTLPASNLSLLQNLKQPRRALSAADAHRDDHIFRAAPLAFDQGMAGHARA
jgi:hypothetical protein